MGNFSRDTFDPNKNYLGVRLQQGVPLVDADWNELNDVVRHEAYQGFAAIANPSTSELRVFMGSSAFRVVGYSTNNLYAYPGTAFGRGTPLRSSAYIFYDSQPLRDPSVAAAWGVDPVPALTTPSSARTDTVYLDVWDREIDSTEDPDIVNPVIGVETAVRLRREFALRVNEGSAAVPSAPAGHRHYLLARLNRAAGNADVESDMVVDQRSIASAHLPGTHYVQIPTFFNPYSTTDPWRCYIAYAYKPTGDAVGGIIPLQLPDGCRLERLHFRGTMAGVSSGITRLFVRIYRSTPTSNSASDTLELVGDDRTNDASFSRYLFVPAEERRVDAYASKYFIYTYAYGPGSISLRGIQIRYEV